MASTFHLIELPGKKDQPDRMKHRTHQSPAVMPSFVDWLTVLHVSSQVKGQERVGLDPCVALLHLAW